ncbi:MAG: hypothetical protein JRG93_05360 [Deltaproteobacteria bacterium]|nr:hypothetical protein [Deltaproteobacteria bacterium]MBW2189009.1 hypothetical protein [Deltaproteobacteria bacterium]MBW2223481.1 hypothetical protein [Deltaproteobacteria bacterium]MBW2403075.1 hypothetical protein [Deltaproteobacteria bacterium]MBW2547091.1 hypothetical protein [Deltaproteobacteria bacterium]
MIVGRASRATNERTIDLAVFPDVGDWSSEDRRMMADLIVGTMVSASAELLEAHGEAREEVTERATEQLRLIALGASMWRKQGPIGESAGHGLVDSTGS